MTDLRARIVRASRSQGITSLLGKAINLPLAIVLARLLFPEDYGLFAIALIVTSVANLFSQIGLQTYIIQAKELTAETLNTCYTLNIVFSLALGCLIATLGLLWINPPDLLPQMLALYGVQIFLSGLSNIELGLLKRELDFALSSRVDLAYTIVSMGGRVGFAAAHFGALCFPLGDLLGSFVRWLFVRRLSRAELRLTVPRSAASREALTFGFHTTSGSLASLVTNQTDKLLVAANHSVAAVGLYSFGGNTAAMFYNAFIVPQTSVVHATIARLRQDPNATRAILTVSSRLVFSLALPLNVLWLLEPHQLLEAIFGAHWVPAGSLIPVFAVCYLFRSVFFGFVILPISLGLAAAAARVKWTNALIFVAFLLVAAWLQVGIVGYALAYLIADLVATGYSLHVNGRLVDIRWVSYARNLIPPLAIALASTLAWSVTKPYFENLPLWPSLFGSVGIWLLTYTLLSLGFNRMMFSTLFGLLRREGS